MHTHHVHARLSSGMYVKTGRYTITLSGCPASCTLRSAYQCRAFSGRTTLQRRKMTSSLVSAGLFTMGKRFAIMSRQHQHPVFVTILRYLEDLEQVFVIIYISNPIIIPTFSQTIFVKEVVHLFLHSFRWFFFVVLLVVSSPFFGVPFFCFAGRLPPHFP